MIAVNAAAPIKKTSTATNTQAMPLIFRRFFTGIGADTEPGASGPRWSPKGTVSVYSATPSPNRNPQLRQNRSSDGIAERQLEQVVRRGVESTGKGISGFCDINCTCLDVKRKLLDFSIRDSLDPCSSHGLQ
jgi:hypothetical protein